MTRGSSTLQRGASGALFLIAVAIAATFIWMTGRSLPARVASHFGTSGFANGFLSHKIYVIATLCACILLPVLVVIPINLALQNPNAPLNIPNRDYWLAPERRAASVEFVQAQMTRFGVALLLFIGYAHWLVVQANERSPPRLASVSFVSALAVFLGFVIVWIAIFLNRFRT